LIFLRSLHKCINPPEASDVYKISPNHETCVKTERYFSSWAKDGQKPLSLFSNSSFISQKHSLKKTYLDMWNRGFVEMKGNEGDEGLLNY